jgi:hypothetical protein
MEGENMNQHDFIVVGILTQAGPITVHLNEPPYVNEVLETGPGWQGIEPGTKLRVTYIKLQTRPDQLLPSIPQSMIHVVAM